MERIRLIEDGPTHPYLNMATDEAIAISVGKCEAPPTLRLYGWSPHAVSIGYFQELECEVDTGFCASNGILAVRRITGGGAVFHGLGELTYSFSAPQGDDSIPADVGASYRVICDPIVAVLRGLGAAAVFRPINDIEVGGRKVSGNAQTRRFGTVLQHGTILRSIDGTLLQSLRVKAEKLQGKGVDSVLKRVTSLQEALGHDVGFEVLAESLAKEFGKSFGCKVLRGHLTSREEGLIPDLRQKYASEEWLRRR